MKNTVSRILLILLSALLLVCPTTVFVSCDTNDKAVNESDTDTAPETPIETLPDELSLSGYTIVRPSEDKNGAYEAAVKLRSALQGQYHTVLSLLPDCLSVEEGHDPDACEILVGSTSYSESINAAKELTAQDFLVRAVGKKIVILGGNREATEMAVDYFLQNCVRKSDNGAFVSLKVDHTFRHEYKFAETDITVCSLNLRYAHSPDENMQAEREPLIAEFVQTYKPDSIGMQECEKFWRTRLDRVLVGYKNAIDTPISIITKNFIWYNVDRVKVVDWGVFWLSETPDEQSKGFGSRFWISCCWAIFEIKETGAQYVHMNTHLNVDDGEIRKKETKVLLERAQAFLDEGYAVLMTGDFNCGIKSVPVGWIYDAGFVSSQHTAPVTTDMGTYSGFDYNKPYGGPGDFVFGNSHATPLSCEVIDKWRDANGNMVFLSDHNAVFTKFSLYKR